MNYNMDEQTKAALERQNPWWFKKDFDTGISRLNYYPELKKYLDTSEILLVVGARRTGKSTLMYQLVRSLNTQPESVLFVNLDEPLFQSRSDDPIFLRSLIEEYITQYPDIKKFYLFIDEIQNYSFWASTVKTFYDTDKRLKFVLTGSTSSLLKDSASTKLSGRYFSTVVYPLSFREFLAFKEIKKHTVLENKKYFLEYLRYGAFPRVVLEKDTDLKQELLKNYFQTIYLKDIIYPYKIRNNKDVFDLLYFVLSNVGKPFSYTSLGKTLGISTETAQEYLNYAEQAYLLFSVNKYDFSLKKQLANPKKVYCLDSGMVNSLSFRFSENKGRLLENLVYILLRRSFAEIFYHKGDKECDFIVKEGLKITRAIQVAVSLKDEEVKKRELKGLLEAMASYNLRSGAIITESEKETIKIEGKVIEVVPVTDLLT